MLLALAASWALADDVTTILTLPRSPNAVAGAVAARGPQEMRPWRVALVASSLLVVVAEAPRWPGTTVPAGQPSGRWRLGLLAAVAAAAALALSLRTAPGDVFWGPLHTAVVCLGAAAMVADAAALARWGGSIVAGCGLAAAVTAAALMALTAAPLPTRRPVRGAAQVVAGLAAGPALALAALDGDRLWVALLATGLGLAVVATTPQRHQLGWVPAWCWPPAAGSGSRTPTSTRRRPTPCPPGSPAGGRGTAASTRPGVRLLGGLRQRDCR